MFVPSGINVNFPELSSNPKKPTLAAVANIAVPVPELPVPFALAVNFVPTTLSVEPKVVQSVSPAVLIIYSVPLTIAVAATSADPSFHLNSTPLSLLSSTKI